MFTDIVAPNIFKPRNDWNVITFNCRKSNYEDLYILRVAKIIKDETGIDPLSKHINRKRNRVDSRQLFAVMMIRHTNRTYESIGNVIGKNYATVWHSEKVISKMFDTDIRFREMYKRINEKVSNLI